MEKIYTIDDLMQAIKESGRSYDTERILAAYQVAKEAHKEQRRRSGEPYISHPVAVAIILVGLGMDTETLAAALLHDVVEDTATTGESIEKQFGEDVALMVNGVTKLGQVPFSTREEQQAENVRKMLLAMAQDVRVIIIKLADRLHNMRTLESMPPQKQRDKSLETMEVYAPLAHRLGLKLVKEELEDTALRFLDPAAYSEIESQLILRKDERDKFLSMIRERLTERLNSEGMHFHLESRVKSIYGIYRKVYIQGRDFDEIFDAHALRVIVDTVNECYNVLGVVHDMFRPIPNRFKDYISTPKANMYQSLHTTVLDKEGIPFEIQIRTWDMHYIAEYGVAAHWKYKAGLSGKDSLQEKLAWVRQLLEAQQDKRRCGRHRAHHQNRYRPGGSVCVHPQGRCHQPAVRLHHHRLCLCHSLGGGQPHYGRQGGWAHHAHRQYGGENRHDHRDHHRQHQGPQPRLAQGRQDQRGTQQDPRLVQKGEAGGEHRRRPGGTGTGVPGAAPISLTEQQEEEFLGYLAEKQQMKNVDDFLAAIGYGGISLAKIAPRIKIDYVKMFRILRGGRRQPRLCPSWCRRSPRCPAVSLSRGWTAAWSSLPSAAIRCPAMRSSGSSPGVRVRPSTSWTAPMSSIR